MKPVSRGQKTTDQKKLKEFERVSSVRVSRNLLRGSVTLREISNEAGDQIIKPIHIAGSITAPKAMNPFRRD